MKTTTPVFIVGSGRSGTRMLYKLIAGNPTIEVYHEYLCTHIQPVACKYFMGLKTKQQTKDAIRSIHGSAIYYSDSLYWVDCSNKLSWIIEPLHELYPNAIFINIIRDGRKVVSSFFYKLSAEIYDDESVAAIQQWLRHPRKYPEPPPEKKYWWNIPQPGQPFYNEFPSFGQFERICYHWTEVNRVIRESFKRLPAKQAITMKLEDLTTKREALKKFLAVFNVSYEEHFFTYMKTPQGVFFPMNMHMTKEEEAAFYRICGNMMKTLGYKASKAYDVTY